MMDSESDDVFYLVLTGNGLENIDERQVVQHFSNIIRLNRTDRACQFLIDSFCGVSVVPDALKRYCDTLSVDINVVPKRALSSFKLVMSDMDSTFITIECIDEIADWLGKKDEVAQITERAMQGKIDFQESLCQRVALLKGVPERELENVYRDRLRLTCGAKELVNATQRVGAKFILVSGGFTFFTKRLQKELGLDEAYANSFEIENGLLTGRVEGEIVDSHFKRNVLEKKCIEFGISSNDVIAIGDGANDLPMLCSAGIGVAFHAKEKVQKATCYHINYGGLATILDWFY